MPYLLPERDCIFDNLSKWPAQILPELGQHVSSSVSSLQCLCPLLHSQSPCCRRRLMEARVVYKHVLLCACGFAVYIIKTNGLCIYIYIYICICICILTHINAHFITRYNYTYNIYIYVYYAYMCSCCYQLNSICNQRFHPLKGILGVDMCRSKTFLRCGVHLGKNGRSSPGDVRQTNFVMHEFHWISAWMNMNDHAWHFETKNTCVHALLPKCNDRLYQT